MLLLLLLHISIGPIVATLPSFIALGKPRGLNDYVYWPFLIGTEQCISHGASEGKTQCADHMLVNFPDPEFYSNPVFNLVH